MRHLRVALLLWLAVGDWTPAAAEPSRYAVVVSGISGSDEFRDPFWEWSSKMVLSLKEPMQFPEENIFFLAEDPDRDASLVTAQSVKSELLQVMMNLELKVKPNDLLFLLLLGHGNFDGTDYRFNLKGPDLTGAELSAILDRFLSQRVVLVCTTAASGALIPKLSGKNRIILTATKSGHEGNQTVFARFFVESFQTQESDSDKDRQVSVLEAYRFTQRKVQEWYEDKKLLATEHSRLDDNGDGIGSDHLMDGGDEGALASSVTLGAPIPTMAQGPAPPELQALLQTKLRLESSIRELKSKKETLPANQYQRRLEAMLIELARTTRDIKRTSGN